ncbi:prostaglandin E synthase 3-like [Saccoglossus kowalevskii]|uniref:Uncharacterized protein ZC395.10-like n=1 Tax=Saccoglossus kowalevskii TaxID=10224 RepID=A0ABM0GLN2_SACKO|nr:PREDICTED: uncharacterized protein ZC395.10-like [Saccoglossus kowalevskii]
MASDGVTMHPPILWAQRADVVFLTVDVSDLQKPEIKLDDKRLFLKGKCGHDDKMYLADLEFFGDINPKDSRYAVRDRNIEFIIKKKESAPYWDRLLKLKNKYHWLKTDFHRWKDEDDSDVETDDKSLEDMMAQMGGGFDGDMPDMDDIGDENGKETGPDSDDEELPDLE